MTLRQLRYFTRIVELGSFTAAAAQLRVAQPALSRHVRVLEEELGVTLLERTPKGIQPTEIGALFLERVTAILHEVQQAQDLISEEIRNPRGKVIVGITPTIGMVLTDKLSTAAASEFPNIQLQVVESMGGLASEWLDWIRLGRLDWAVLYGVEHAADLEVEPLVAEELHLVRKGRPTRHASAPIRFADLGRFDIILPSAPHPLRQIIEALAAQEGVELSIAKEIDSLVELKAALRQGRGCSIQALSAVTQERRNQEVIANRIIDPEIRRVAYLVSSAQRRSTRAVREVGSVIKRVTEQLVKSGAWPATLR